MARIQKRKNTPRMFAAERKLIATIVFCLAALQFVSFDNPPSLPPSLNDSIISQITGAEQMRFFGGYKQGTDTSCGIAATCSLLQFFYGIEIDEKELIARFFTSMEQKGNYTLSMLDIKSVCESYGFTTKSPKIDLKTLLAYDSYAPIVLHLLRPQSHFTLYIGSYGQYIFLDDPSVGVYFLPAEEFTAKFGGIALFVYGKDTEKNTALIAEIRSMLTERIRNLYALSQPGIIR